MEKNAYNWWERRQTRVNLIVFGLIAWGIGCLITFFMRDMNWLWGCYTMELCLLWPYKGASPMATLGMALAVSGEALLWWGLLIGNRGEGRPAKEYRIEGVVKLVLGMALSVPYILFVPAGLFQGGQVVIMALFFGIGCAAEALMGMVLVVQGIGCLKRARKAPKTEKRQKRVYYRAE